jgi:hypothetical protein
MNIIIILILYTIVFGFMFGFRYYMKKRTLFYDNIHLDYLKDFKEQLEEFKEQAVDILVVNKLVNLPTIFYYKLDLKKIPRYYRNEQEIRYLMFTLQDYLFEYTIYNINHTKFEIDIVLC